MLRVSAPTCCMTIFNLDCHAPPPHQHSIAAPRRFAHPVLRPTVRPTVRRPTVKLDYSIVSSTHSLSVWTAFLNALSLKLLVGRCLLLCLECFIANCNRSLIHNLLPF